MSEERIEKKFQVEESPSVRIENVNGLVVVHAGSPGEVAVEAVKHSNGDMPVEIEQKEDGSILVSARPNKSRVRLLDFGTNKSKVDFHVTMPAEANLTVKAVNAKTTVEGIHGDVHLGSVNGQVAVSDVSGELKFDTVNGNIEGKRISGHAALKTVNGKIAVSESDLPSLKAGTVNGSIHLETPVGEGPYELKSVSGNVKISTGDAPKGRVHFKSIGGQVRVNNKRVGQNGTSFGPARQVFELGDGGPEIIFKSVSGNLEFLSDSGEEIIAAPVEVKSDEAPVDQSSPELMDILDKISNGELSVEEGIEELENS